MISTTKTNWESALVSHAFLQDPYPLLHQMREQEPIYWSDSIGGWILTRYEDIMATFKDTESFSNEGRLGKAVEYLPPEKRAKYKPFEDHYATKGLLHSDPPDHTRMRNVIVKDFTPNVVEQMRPNIQSVVNHLIEEAERNGGMDVVPEFASALPVGVIAEILGVPRADRHLFKRWTDMILGFQGVNKPSEGDLTRAQDGLQEIRPYLTNMIEERRKQPRKDLMSKFVTAMTEEGRISESELINTCVTLFTAGHETTLSLISSTIYTLLSHPDQLALLRENPDLLKSTIEESLRFESPVSRQTRLMKQDASLNGKALKKGQLVFQMLNAANRDPAYFKDPDTFNIRRENNRHIAFGFGPHFCIGATLARTEAFIAVGTLIQRFPNLRLVDPKPDWDSEKRNSRVLNKLAVKF
ncbi:MAG: cytochrome P450 [Verrucomicrobia bacterium]|nr:cytochrome P450 [Verrucomicrobiota bacterium]